MNTPPAGHGYEQRLAAARLAAQASWSPSAEEVRRILKERARALAQEAAPEDGGECTEALAFLLAEESYAVEVRWVREVRPPEHLTPLPCTPDFVAGIANLRGEFISVVDLKSLFGLAPAGAADAGNIIVLESHERVFGILADAVDGVRQFPREQTQPSLATLTGACAAYLLGVTAGRTVILDASKLLSDDGLIVDDRV